MGTFDNRCRCEGAPMHGSDHCAECGCEEFEERCEWAENLPFDERSEGSRWSQALRRGR
jgi:hypothetical protein